MKNIHVLPTDKPSRLFDFMTALVLLKKASPNDSGTNQHIYITTDEEIKEGDYGILGNGDITRYENLEYYKSKYGEFDCVLGDCGLSYNVEKKLTNSTTFKFSFEPFDKENGIYSLRLIKNF